MRLRNKIIIIVLILFVGVGLGVGGMVVKNLFFPGGEKKVEARQPDEIGPLLDLGEFMVNLNGGGILKTEITVEGFNKESAEKLEEQEVFLRDCVNSVLSSKKITDVSNSAGRKELKSELVTELNEVCDGEIQDVLFSTFIYSY